MRKLRNFKPMILLVSVAVLLLSSTIVGARQLAQTNPTITVGSTTGALADPIVVYGNNWTPGSAIAIFIAPPDGMLQTATQMAQTVADPQGSFTVAAPPPGNFGVDANGVVKLIATGATGEETEVLMQFSGADPTPTAPPIVIEATPTPVLVAPPTAALPTPAAGNPTLIANTNVNVRSGPGSAYDVLGMLASGQSAEITGLSYDRAWWQIKFPPAPGGLGWVSTQYAKAYNTQNVPFVAAPPSPTPAPIPVNNWRGEYFSNPDVSGQATLTRDDQAINFNWGSGAPAPGLPADGFSVRWTRALDFEGGTYTFNAHADDGIRAWVDNALIIDQWRGAGGVPFSVDFNVAPGRHTIKVEFHELGGDAYAIFNWQARQSATPTPAPGAWVQAVIDGPTSGEMGQPLSFNGSRSNAGGTYIQNYIWDFGDGTTAVGRETQHIYNATGDYTIRLTVSDPQNRQDTATSRLHIHQDNYGPPQAIINGPTSGKVGERLNFNGRNAYAPGNSIVRYSWDFGDGHTAEGIDTSHVYDRANIYTVRLTVLDERNVTHQSGQDVTISDDNGGGGGGNIAPQAAIVGPDTARVGELINFDGSYSDDVDGHITSFYWRLGDGATATGARTSHRYNGPGDYTVSLTVRDNSGAENTNSYVIRVSQ